MEFLQLELGLTELIAFAVANIGGGWALLRISFSQFEMRLDDRFKLLDNAMADVKRIELEIVWVLESCMTWVTATTRCTRPIRASNG